MYNFLKGSNKESILFDKERTEPYEENMGRLLREVWQQPSGLWVSVMVTQNNNGTFTRRRCVKGGEHSSQARFSTKEQAIKRWKKYRNLRRGYGFVLVAETCSGDAAAYYPIKQMIQKEIKQKRYTRKSIPKILKNLIWDTNIGEEKGVGKCYCCGQKINSKHFEAGHIIAVKNGGTNTLDNLKPICDCCNKSIGTMNMDIFKQLYMHI